MGNHYKKKPTAQYILRNLKILLWKISDKRPGWRFAPGGSSEAGDLRGGESLD